MKAQVKALLNAEPVLPGTLEERYNVCGKADCRCKDKINPRKHGPYYRLSYSVKGKNSSVFVSKEDAGMIKEMTGNYRKARSNTQELSLEMVQAYRQEGLQGMLTKYSKLTERENRKKSGVKPESTLLRETRISRDGWKNKALARQNALEKNRVKIRDMKKSRKNWKIKAIKAQKKVEELRKEVADAEKRISKTEKSDSSKKKLCGE
ncbi:MAG: DUF6788 family protein [Candidatus Marinimicrobia bacterium]|nr:DUF6788 family protein [Candidatus Neomarinimicrobiota bacterium]